MFQNEKITLNLKQILTFDSREKSTGRDDLVPSNRLTKNLKSCSPIAA